MTDGEGEKKKKKDETEELEKVKMPMELGMFLPKKVGESAATVQLEEINLIRMVSERGMKKVYKKFALRKGLPNFNTNSDMMDMISVAGFDQDLVAGAKKELKTAQKEYKLLRQQVNAALAVAQDSLELSAALALKREVSEDRRKECNERAVLLAGICGQMIASVGTRVADKVADDFGICSSEKMRELIADPSPMSAEDRLALSAQMIHAEKFAQAAEKVSQRRKRKRSGSNNDNNGGYGGKGGNNNGGGYGYNWGGGYHGGKKGGGKKGQKGKRY